jgi:hypothetical protein
MSSSIENEIACMDADGHGRFRDLCVIYGDSYRDVFLEEIQGSFIRNANKNELSAVRKAVTDRAAKIAHGGKRGRPRSQDDLTWLTNTRIVTWKRIVEGWTWWQIAESQGMNPTPGNIRTIERTLKRQMDKYAVMIWKTAFEAAIWQDGSDDASILSLLEKKLDTFYFKALLWIRCGLPFGRFAPNDLSEGCRKIVLVLALPGQHASAMELVRRLRRKKQTARNTGPVT